MKTELQHTRWKVALFIIGRYSLISSTESDEIGCFLTGIMDPIDWEFGKWIKQPASITSAPMFFQQFKLSGRSISKATMLVSRLGYFLALVNGVDINTQATPPIYVAPGWTECKTKVQYYAIDIKES